MTAKQWVPSAAESGIACTGSEAQRTGFALGVQSKDDIGLD